MRKRVVILVLATVIVVATVGVVVTRRGSSPKPPRVEVAGQSTTTRLIPETELGDLGSCPRAPQHPLLPLRRNVSIA